MAYWVGLTGGIGSGKSKAATEFLKFGVPVIDADEISRNLTADNGLALPDIRRVFGSDVFDEVGSLDRSAMRDLIFRRPQAKLELEALMFPLIFKEIERQKAGFSDMVYGIVDVPLLIEKPMFCGLIQRILVVDAADEVRLERVKLRSGLSENEIKRIIAAQVGRMERLLYADDVLRNEGSFLDFEAKIARLHHYYQARFTYLDKADS
ncbi:dephospho-CoA kinase [Neisseria weaveri]|uniref:dephospho-CoA kinase n=1 Tax=Neisseria weaveri TaxID=28091 RepID=UPI000D312C9F|nr:dephospho-CoA kinase [Neisseria weaveri]